MGYLSADPKFNEFQSGKKKAEFSLGISTSPKETLWIDVECWDKIAENCNKYIKKGSLVFVDGKLKYNSWTDKNGNKRNKITCVCDFIKIINVKNQDDKKISKNEIEEISQKDEDIELQKELDNIPW